MLSMFATVAESRSALVERERVREQIGTATRTRWRKLLVWAISAVCLAGLVAGLWWWRASSKPAAPVWLTDPVTRGDIRESVSATGTLEPRTEVIVGAEVSGKIAEVLVDDNDRVEQGQVLARFDLESFERELEEARGSLAAARAEVLRAKAGLGTARLEAERTDVLFGQDVVAREEQQARAAALAQAEADLAAAYARRRIAQAQVEQVQTRIGKTEVRSPISGVVLRRAVEPGSTIQAAFQSPELFTIAADLGEMQLELEIDEADVGRVQPDALARFEVDAWPGREFLARVVEVALAPTITGNVVSYVATLEVDNDEQLLRPGMTATAQIETGVSEQVLRVPTAALRFSPPTPAAKGFRLGPPPASRQHAIGSAVWLLRDQQPVRVPVTTGSSDGPWTEIVAGDLAVGDHVIVGREGET